MNIDILLWLVEIIFDDEISGIKSLRVSLLMLIKLLILLWEYINWDIKHISFLSLIKHSLLEIYLNSISSINSFFILYFDNE